MHKAETNKPFTKEQEDKVERYLHLASEFNITHNIFARKDENEIFDEDIMDCYPVLQKIGTCMTVADLGSGGGLPGILIAITKPKNKISLIESNQKKCYFLRCLIEELELKNTKVINKTITKKNNLGLFDVITARAFAQTEKIISLTKNNIHKTSKYVLLKGKSKKILEELQLLDVNEYKYEITKLDHQTKERNLVTIKKNE